MDGNTPSNLILNLNPETIFILNPLVTNGLSHPYHLDEFTFIFRGVMSNFSFLFHFSMKFMKANRVAPDGTLHFAASHLGLFCLPMSNKKDARLIWINSCFFFNSDCFPFWLRRRDFRYDFTISWSLLTFYLRNCDWGRPSS